MLMLAGDVSFNSWPAPSHNVRFATTIIRSVWSTDASLSDLLLSKRIDILAVIETRLRPHDIAACISDISPSGYTFLHRPHSVGRCGVSLFSVIMFHSSHILVG